MIRARIMLLAALAAGAQAAGQESNIAEQHRYSWQENCGWMNWRDAGNPVGSHGALVNHKYLQGWVWMENAGWLTVGDGTPGLYADCTADGLLTSADFACFQSRFVGNDPYADCTRDRYFTIADFACFQTAFVEQRPAGSYSNLRGSDAGVNILLDGTLQGFAWGENIGWVNFGTQVLGEMRARYDRSAQRFRGFAWGENVGWVNLDDETYYVGTFCYPDCDGNGVLTIADFGCFQLRFALGEPEADCNEDGALTIADFGCVQAQFVAGCP